MRYLSTNLPKLAWYLEMRLHLPINSPEEPIFCDAPPNTPLILLREKKGNAGLDRPLGRDCVIVINGIVIDRAKHVDRLLA